MDCLRARDILGWLEQLPNAYFTLVFDCEPSFIANFGKQRDPEVVDIMEDPWSLLTDLGSSALVLYLRPDVGAMAKLRQRDKDTREVVGMLTESFNFALTHFQAARGEVGMCHQSFYEAMSFHWHKRGRWHRAFVPAVAVSLKHALCLFCVCVVMCSFLCRAP